MSKYAGSYEKGAGRGTVCTFLWLCGGKLDFGGLFACPLAGAGLDVAPFFKGGEHDSVCAFIIFFVSGAAVNLNHKNSAAVSIFPRKSSPSIIAGKIFGRLSEQADIVLPV